MRKADADVAIQISEFAERHAAAVLKRGQTFGAHGMHITVQGLSYSVQNNQNKKETLYLLRDVTASFKPHNMTALMGPSGSGKTTLLDLLAGRKTVGRTEGSILFAGNKPTSQFLRRYTGYVEQFDTLLPMLTVEEMLLYTAELKRPLSEPLAAKKAAVDELLDKLGLTGCRSVKVGNPLAKGISGGQAKRVNIGIALITSPRVLFLDEPTSGLDSFTANEVTTVIKALAADGVTILATIHSPTAYAFSLFDSLVMLVRGRVAYFGEAGRSTISYISSVEGAESDAAKHQLGASAALNPAEWMVDLFTKADREGQAAFFADAYAASDLKRANDEEAYRLATSCSSLPDHVQKQLATRTETVTPWWWGLKTLIKYRTSYNYRDGAFLGPRVGEKVVMGLLIVTLYLGIGDDFVADNFMNISSVLFMWITLPAFSAAAYVPSIVLERNLYVRERSDGLYRVFTYLAAKMVDELAINAVASLAISALAFYAIRLQGSFLLFFLIYFTTLAFGIVLAYFVAAMSPNMGVANACLPLYVSTLLFFTGFLLLFDNIPVWWGWYSYINPLRYAWTAAMINQFGGRADAIFLGQTVLQYYGMEGQSAWANLGYLACFVFFLMVCAWAALRFKRYQQR